MGVHASHLRAVAQT